jgi:arabinofuranosyltransferase
VRRWSKATLITFASFAAVLLVYAFLAFQRRWIADDGLIVGRTVRQILDGSGPVFNGFERAEANTSTLWTYLLVAFAAITRASIPYLAVFLGILLAVTAVYLGMDATRRLLRARGITGPIVPAAALVVVGMYPFWDYASSGLETGLSFAWIALCWWLLVRGDRLKLCAFVFGLGPLVRPDLGIGAIVYFITLWALHRPTWRNTLKLAAIGMALPVAYEIFRAGYYGVLVPLPGIAKSATNAAWGRGWEYLRDYNHPYFVWVPFVVAIALFAYAMRRRLLAKRELILVAAPVLTGAINMLYVLRVGGDFMHARLLLVPTFAMLLPCFVVPVRRFTKPAITVFALWAAVTIYRVGDGRGHATRGIIGDERYGYTKWTKHPHPINPAVFIRADTPGAPNVAHALATGQRQLISAAGLVTKLNPAYPERAGYVVGRLGTGGEVAPLDVLVIDTLGLANPLGAHITPTLPGYTGHEKVLPWSWIHADYGDPAADATNEYTTADEIAAARRALKCGELKELLDSVREPMSVSRFIANLTGSVRRTRLSIPSDPYEAEQRFCGSTSRPIVKSSTEYVHEGWGKYGVVDGVKDSQPPKWGFTSLARDDQATEWISLKYGRRQPVSKVTLYPANEGEYFPADFQIQIWNGTSWVTRVTKTDYVAKGRGPHEFAWSPADETTQIRILVTKLRVIDARYMFQFAEIEVAP